MFFGIAGLSYRTVFHSEFKSEKPLRTSYQIGFQSNLRRKKLLPQEAKLLSSSGAVIIDMLADRHCFLLFHLNRYGSPPGVVISLVPLWFPWWFYVQLSFLSPSKLRPKERI